MWSLLQTFKVVIADMATELKQLVQGHSASKRWIGIPTESWQFPTQENMDINHIYPDYNQHQTILNIK